MKAGAPVGVQPGWQRTPAANFLRLASDLGLGPFELGGDFIFDIGGPAAGVVGPTLPLLPFAVPLIPFPVTRVGIETRGLEWSHLRDHRSQCRCW